MTKFISYLSIIFFALTFTACGSDWLYLTPQDAIINDQFWKTKEQVESAVIGCYASLLGNNDANDLVGPMSEYLFLWGELRGDMLLPTAQAKQPEIDIINGNILATNTICNWKAPYITINQCNTIIQNAPKVQLIDKTFKDAQLNAYVAEARALRAMMYFYLVRTFGDVPLKIKPTTTDAEIVLLPKSDKDLVLNQILQDLRVAEQSAVSTFGKQSFDKGRITRYTVNAIQADVYLWREQYDSCVMACDKIINSSQFGLVTGFDNWFKTIYVDGNSNESIFEFQFDAQKLNTFYPMFGNPRRFIAQGSVLEDIFSIESDIRGSGASILGDGTIWKYLGLTRKDPRQSIESYAHWIVYRYSEILLFKAEALAQLNKGQEALDIIQVIRNRAFASAATEEGPSNDDIDGITNYILHERQREFAFEGKRWFDLLRNARRNNYAKINLLIDAALQSAPKDKQQSIANKLKDINSHYLPIYQYELQTNKNLEQNPFYLK